MILGLPCYYDFKDGNWNTLKEAEAKIPKGIYCYNWIETPRAQPTGEIKGKVKTCPFLACATNKPHQMNGYCSVCRAGDWMRRGTFLLWDQCKECGINDDYGEDGITFTD